MEMTYKNWFNWNWWRDTNYLTNSAHEEKDHKYHKMAACEKMSRKRLVKLLMATGNCDKHKAEKIAAAVNNRYCKYSCFWNQHRYELIRTIDVRLAMKGDSKHRALNRIFGAILYPEMMPVSPWFWVKGKGYDKEDWQKDKEFMEAHPEITTPQEAQRAKFYDLKSMQESGKWNMENFQKFGRLESWLMWSRWEDDKVERTDKTNG